MRDSSRSSVRWITPAFVLNATFLVYFAPVVLIALTGSNLLEGFAPVRLRYPGYCVAIFCLNWVVLNLILFAVPTVGLRSLPVFRVSTVRTAIVWIYLIAGFCSLAFLNARLEIWDLIQALLTGDLVGFGMHYGAAGSALITQHLLGYYFLSNLLIISAYLLRPRLHGFAALLCNVGLLALIIDYLLISRREIVMLIVLIWLLDRLSHGFKTNRNVILLLASILIIFVAIINLRTGNSLLNLSSFASSQEFSPFQFGAYLVDNGVSDLRIGSPLDLAVRIPNYTTVAGRELANHFYYREIAGPTVSINHLLFNYGYLPVCMYCIMFFALCKAVYRRYLADCDPIFTVLYAFLYIKMFILVRNGEIAIHYLDIAIFAVMCSPFVFFGEGAGGNVKGSANPGASNAPLL